MKIFLVGIIVLLILVPIAIANVKIYKEKITFDLFVKIYISDLLLVMALLLAIAFGVLGIAILIHMPWSTYTNHIALNCLLVAGAIVCLSWCLGGLAKVLILISAIFKKVKP